MDNQGDADDFPKLGAKALLEAAHYARWFAAVLSDDDPDDPAIEYWSRHDYLLTKLADEWSAPEDGWKDGNVIPFIPRSVKVKALPPERGRRES